MQIFFVSSTIARSCVTSDEGYVRSLLLARARPTIVHSKNATVEAAYVVTAPFSVDDRYMCFLHRTLIESIKRRNLANCLSLCLPVMPGHVRLRGSMRGLHRVKQQDAVHSLVLHSMARFQEGRSRADASRGSSTAT